MDNKTDLNTGFERGIKFALFCIEQNERSLKAEIDFITYKLGHGHNMSNYELECQQEKRSELNAALKQLQEVRGSLSLVLSA